MSPVLIVQPTVPALPWSARQAQVWSMITLLLLTTRLVVALPAVAPPMRKKTSCSVVGLAAWSAVEPDGPTVSSAAELVVPASNSRPLIRTPSTSATCMALTPLSGISVG